MKNKEKPIYEEPKVFKLDEREAVYGGGPGNCNSTGSSAVNDCYMNGNNASIGCTDGNNASGSCEVGAGFA